MQKILVAGGAGFIGSHLIRALLQNNYHVFCLDNYITGNKANVSDLLENDHFTMIEEDVITLLDSVADQIGSLDAIFHLASPASPNKKSPRSYINFPIETLLVNSQGTHRLLEIARKTNATFLFASTSEIYGDPQVSPQSEEYFGNVNPNGIRSVYDEAKRFGEAITFGYMRKYDVDARIIRIFNTYGPNMQKDDGRVVSNFINQALQNKPITIYGDGMQTRSFCYVSDMVDGIMKAMFTQNTKGQVFNIGNPDERTIADIANIIKEMVDATSKITHEALPEDDPKVRKPSIEKAKQELQWKPSVSLEEGLRKTITYFKGVDV